MQMKMRGITIQMKTRKTRRMTKQSTRMKTCRSIRYHLEKCHCMAPTLQLQQATLPKSLVQSAQLAYLALAIQGRIHTLLQLLLCLMEAHTLILPILLGICIQATRMLGLER